MKMVLVDDKSINQSFNVTNEFQEGTFLNSEGLEDLSVMSVIAFLEFSDYLTYELNHT